MLRVLPFLLLALSCAKNVPQPLPDCRCARSQHPVTRDYERADTVFVGTVVGMNPAPAMENPTRRSGPRVQAVHIDVLSQYKGGAVGNVTVYVDTIWNCAYPFQVGETYLVYAWQEHRFKNKLTTTRCVRTDFFDNAKKDIRELRRIRAKEARQ